MEFQQRGAVHFHILTDLEQWHINLYQKELARFWATLVEEPDIYYMRIAYNKRLKKFRPNGREARNSREAVYDVHVHPSTWQVLRSADGAARYVTKYALKVEQKEVPPGFRLSGRFWGAPHAYSIKNLVEKWTYVDENSLQEILALMGRDFSSYEYLPKIIVGDTSRILEILEREQDIDGTRQIDPPDLQNPNNVL